MRYMHEYLKTAPFDLYELYLFHLVAKHRSFTKAAEAAGLTQSAMTRQMQGMEESLGVDLLERTTRSVRITQAGEFLQREALRLIGDVENALQRLREDFADARKVVRVGVSRSIGLAYLPGFFHANLRRSPHLGCRVSYGTSGELLSLIEANELDLAVLCPPKRLPKTLRVTHRFADGFTLIAPPEAAASFASAQPRNRKQWMAAQSWLLLEETSNTGRQLRAWMSRQGWRVDPAMELDSFDLIINLVALGMGVSFVPTRSLALYAGKRHLRRLRLTDRFSRDLVVAMRKHRTVPEHLAAFVENILF